MTLLRSWVESANSATAPFPLNNLPYGVFSLSDGPETCGVAIGDMILDLAAVEGMGLIDLKGGPYLDAPDWNDLMGAGPAVRAALRAQLLDLPAIGADAQKALRSHLVPQTAVRLHLPITASEFTDFYAGKHHAMNVGTLFRGPQNALPPNWLHMPIGDNGRASSVVVSGTDIMRPNGQTKAPDAAMPSFGPRRQLDIELELGAIIGGDNDLGIPISVQGADDMIFGNVLLNDWSARGIQAWEYQPLGPFQGKCFATSISPWIVTKAALDPFRAPSPEGEVDLLPYLHEPGPMLYDIDLAVTMAPEGKGPTTIARTNYSRMYYSAAQQLAHHASSGCAMNLGDLIGSGTISGPGRSECGSLLELTRGGAAPLTLVTGETRGFVEDGDTLTLEGAAIGEGYRIGFGTCTGTIRPAQDLPRTGMNDHGKSLRLARGHDRKDDHLR